LSVGLVVGAVGPKYNFIVRNELPIIDRLWSTTAVKAGHILKCEGMQTARSERLASNKYDRVLD